jgi:hypothetical protein
MKARQASREPEMLALVKHTRPINEEKTDSDPLDICNKDLDNFFVGRKRNFVAYWGGTPGDPAYMKVRVNGKFHPKDTKIVHPSDMAGFRKTTLVKRRTKEAWTVAEDRVDIDFFMTVPENEEIELMLIFAQPARKTLDGLVYLAPVLDGANMGHVATMSKAQRERFNAGLDSLDTHDEAVGVALRLPLYSAIGAADTVLVITDDVSRVRQYKEPLCIVHTLDFVDAMITRFAKLKPTIVISVWFDVYEDRQFDIEYLNLHGFRTYGGAFWASISVYFGQLVRGLGDHTLSGRFDVFYQFHLHCREYFDMELDSGR